VGGGSPVLASYSTPSTPSGVEGCGREAKGLGQRAGSPSFPNLVIV
jgi:hypothetical protein